MMPEEWIAAAQTAIADRARPRPDLIEAILAAVLPLVLRDMLRLATGALEAARERQLPATAIDYDTWLRAAILARAREWELEIDP